MSFFVAVVSLFRWIWPGLVFVLIVSHIASGQESERAELRYFEHARTIELSDEQALIGVVRSFAVNSRGEFLIDDPQSDVVWIFGPEGELRHQLSPDDCRPGRNPGVSGAYFIDDEILLFSSRRKAYRFARDGSCIGESIDDFSHPKNITSDAQGNIYGYYTGKTGKEDIVKMSRDGQVVSSFGIEKSPFPQVTAFLSDGGLTYYDGYIYSVRVTGPKIHKYTVDGERVNVFGETPDFYRPIKEDLARQSASTPDFSTFGEFYGSHTIPLGLYLLDENLLLIVYRDSEAGGGIQIYHTEGQLLAEAQGLPVYIQYAKDGWAYALNSPDAREDGTVPNPSVEIYRYNGPSAND